jgi:hypothetical protein
VTNYFYGINQGQNEYQAVVGTSTNSTDIEVNVNGANVPDKQSVLLALEKLEEYIMRLNYTPL